MFSSRTSQTLRILHEDESHFRALIWRPVETSSRQTPVPDSSARKTAPTPPPRVSVPAAPPRMSFPAPPPRMSVPAPPPRMSDSAPPPRMAAPVAPPRMAAPVAPPRMPSTPTATPAPPPDLVDLPFDGQSCNGSMTRKRSRDALTKKVSVKITNVPLIMIVDELVSKRRKI